MRRVLCCVLCTLLILALAIPVSAADNNFIELLEYSTVNDSGSNMFQFSSSVTVSLDVPMYTILRYVDLTFTASDNTAPTSVKVKYGSSYYTLSVKQVTSNIYRAYGAVSGYFDMLMIQFNATGSQYYTIESCKVSSVTTSSSAASATMRVQIADTYYSGTIGTTFYNPDFVQYDTLQDVHYQTEITVTDATKYDYISMQFSTQYVSINSIRCTYGSASVPFTCNFIDVESHESFSYYYDNIGEGFTLNTHGKYIGSIDVDLTGIERTKNAYLLIFFGGDGLDYGFNITVSCVDGSVLFADTQNATWRSWANKLLGSVNSLPERIAQEMGKLFKPTEGKLESVQQQSEELAEERLGAVYQAGQVIDGLVGAFQNQTATDYLTVPLLNVPLGEVDWTIGGWTVQVVPDAFKPIVEVLKTVIDIICTLSFVRSMRNRLERLLVGGNA